MIDHTAAGVGDKLPVVGVVNRDGIELLVPKNLVGCYRGIHRDYLYSYLFFGSIVFVGYFDIFVVWMYLFGFGCYWIPCFD